METRVSSAAVPPCATIEVSSYGIQRDSLLSCPRHLALHVWVENVSHYGVRCHAAFLFSLSHRDKDGFDHHRPSQSKHRCTSSLFPPLFWPGCCVTPPGTFLTLLEKRSGFLFELLLLPTCFFPLSSLYTHTSSQLAFFLSLYFTCSAAIAHEGVIRRKTK